MSKQVPLYQLLADEASKTMGKVEKNCGGSLSAMEAFLNAQYELLELTLWTAQSNEFSGRDVTEVVVYSALHKNTFLYFAAMELIRRGLYGPACTLLRPIFESLALAKYCVLAHDTRVFEKWRAGEPVSLTNEVLNRIAWPATDEMRVLWKGLNELAHATKYSQQIASEYEENQKEIRATLAIARMLLCFNYHLLSRHFVTPTAARYTRLYGDEAEFDQAREHARRVASLMRKSFSNDGRRFLKECCASWKLKSVRKGKRKEGQAHRVRESRREPHFDGSTPPRDRRFSRPKDLP